MLMRLGRVCWVGCIGWVLTCAMFVFKERSKNYSGNLSSQYGNDLIVAPLRFIIEPVTKLPLDSMNSSTIAFCMPTISRAGNPGYISRALQTWSAAMKNTPNVLVIIDNDSESGDGFHQDLAQALERYGNSENVLAMKRAIPRIPFEDLPIPELTSRRILAEKHRGTFGQKPDKMKWWTAENQDYTYAMALCEACYIQTNRRKPSYLAILQDDILVSSNIHRLDTILANMSLGEMDWFSVSLYDPRQPVHGGAPRKVNAVAKVYNPVHIPGFVRFVSKNIKFDPIDHLHDIYCNLNKLKTLVIVPNLVQHIGLNSTLTGKTFTLEEGQTAFFAP